MKDEKALISKLMGTNYFKIFPMPDKGRQYGG